MLEEPNLQTSYWGENCESATKPLRATKVPQ
jgi:hypothetical protein